MKTAKRVFSGLLLSGALLASPAYANICLNSRDIVSATSKDGRVMVFTMRDGRVLRNHLQGVCPDLRFNGFVWVLHGNDDVCENMQSLRVLKSGQVCQLGKFEPPAPPKPAAPPAP
jgi:hypothetical protein